jgi:molecular chaperone DnaJ
MLVLAAAGVAFILVNAALTRPGAPPAPDNMVEAGSCVNIEDNGDAREVLCDGSNDGVVQALIPLDAKCGVGTEPHRDRQGMGVVCVRLGTGQD